MQVAATSKAQPVRPPLNLPPQARRVLANNLSLVVEQLRGGDADLSARLDAIVAELRQREGA